MKDKLSQIHKRMRSENIQNYFKQRRIELLQSRYRHTPHSLSQHHLHPLNRSSQNWKNLVLHGLSPSNQLFHNRSQQNNNAEVQSFEMNVTSIETGEYYLNFIVEGATYNYLQQTVFLLAKLIGKLLELSYKLSIVEQKHQNKIVYKILQQIHYYLKIGGEIVNESGHLAFKNSKKTRDILQDMLENDYRQLFKKQDTNITTEIINISFELCSNYNIYPNYQVVKNLITRVVTKENLLPSNVLQKRDTVNEEQQLMEKIEQLLMKFIILFKTQQTTNQKAKNIHHMQIIYQFHSYIEFNLSNILEFVKNHQHPFDYEHINNNLYFNLTLFTQIIKKFKETLKQSNWQTPAPRLLIKAEIMDIIYNMVYIHNRSIIAERQEDEFILSIEEAISTIFRYTVENKSINRRNGSRHTNHWEEWQLGGDDGYILDKLMLIKKRLSELQINHDNLYQY